jgi:hypothetical protein
MTVWNNADGLKVKFDNEIANPTVPSPGLVVEGSLVKTLVVDFSYDKLPDGDNGAAHSGEHAYIPAGSFIKSAYLIAKTDWGGTSPTLTIGLETQAGVAIDADGIDAAIAEAALDAGDVVVCNGALVGGNLIGADNGYIVATTGGTVTSGTARLIVEFVESGAADDAVV